jgi:hypothetical protein
MFLSKRNGIFYLWYDDEKGEKVSTRCTKKSDAPRFLKDFSPSNSSLIVDRFLGGRSQLSLQTN